MKKSLKARIDDLKESFGRLAPREQLAVAALAALVVVLLIGGVGYWVASEIAEVQQWNIDTRQALKDLQRFHDQYAQNQRREMALANAIPETPLELNSYVERAASAVGVKIDESAETKPVKGKRYMRRGLDIKLNKISLAQLATLIQRLQSASKNLVQITRLNVSTRWKQHEELDVQMVVSTYEQAKKAARQGAKVHRRQGRSG